MKTHRFDVLSFVSGLVMTLTGLLFLLPQEPSHVFSILGDIGNWFWPVLLGVVGVAVLAPLAWRRANGDEEGAAQATSSR